MDELKRYVERLFAHTRHSNSIKDLKDEIYSNMLAKKQDLIQQGRPEQEAIAEAKESITSVDELIDGMQLTYVNRFKADCAQTAFLYSVILWILNIPMILLHAGTFSFVAFLTMVAVGIGYFSLRKRNTDELVFLQADQYLRMAKTAWLVWGIFFAVCVICITSLQFGSTLWFGRSIEVTGPYQFGLLALRYYIPLVSILIPLSISSFPKLCSKYEGSNITR